MIGRERRGSEEEWTGLRKSCGSYEGVEREVGAWLGCERWSMLSDKLYKRIKL